LNFGLIDRFSSNQETDGIQDRVEMQTVSIQNIAEREIENKVFGYGFNKVAVVRSQIMPIEDFSKDLRPTGPHNGYIYQVLNYGYVGIILFLVILGYPFFTKRKLINIINSEYILPIFAFLILNFNGDAFQNQSIAWLFWIYLFQISLISDEQ
jgi:O-antigen ligase